MATQIQIQSTNYNGQIASITFYPCSGGTINLGNQTIPYIYTNDNYEGTYDLFFSAFSQTCQLVISCPSPTPTPTLTPTPTEPAGYKLLAESGANLQSETPDDINIEH